MSWNDRIERDEVWEKEDWGISVKEGLVRERARDMPEDGNYYNMSYLVGTYYNMSYLVGLVPTR